jgi:hypothetical protein
MHVLIIYRICNSSDTCARMHACTHACTCVMEARAAHAARTHAFTRAMVAPASILYLPLRSVSKNTPGSKVNTTKPLRKITTIPHQQKPAPLTNDGLCKKTAPESAATTAVNAQSWHHASINHLCCRPHWCYSLWATPSESGAKVPGALPTLDEFSL